MQQKPECSYCKNLIEKIDNVIHCIGCNRWYCSKSDCWVDCNDECFPTSEKSYGKFYNCPQGINGEFEVSKCDNCAY